MNKIEQIFQRKTYLKDFLIGLFAAIVNIIILIIPKEADAQDFEWRMIAKGADTSELYITAYWYDNPLSFDDKWGGIFHSTDNGKTLSVQYKSLMGDSVMHARYIYGDSTPGTVYKKYWISRDYGQTWNLKLNPASYGGPFLCDGCMQGEFYFIGNIISGEDCLFHMTYYGDSMQLMNNQMDSLFAIESGSLPGELFSIKYPWGNYFEDTLALAFSNNYGQSFTVNYIDSSCVTNLSQYTLTNGTEPGELYLIGLGLNPQFSICRTTDYGNTFTLQYTFPFYLSEEYSFVAGRKPGTFYILKTYLAPTLPLHNCFEIHYSCDYGVTYTVYFHELDSTYTYIPTNSSAIDYFTCYPNPATDHIQVDLQKSESRIDLYLFDLRGNLLITSRISPGQKQARIDVSQLPPGVYLLKVTDGKRVIGVEKVVVD